MATCGGAQVALQQCLILRPGNNQCSKNLKKGGHFSIITLGYFWLVISKYRYGALDMDEEPLDRSTVIRQVQELMHRVRGVLAQTQKSNRT